MDMKTVRRQARERMGAACRVCPQCDGRACAGELPGMGGIRSGASFRANVTALERYRLKMRVIHDIPGVDHIGMACTVLGHDLAMPVLIAPLAGARFNMGGALSEERFAAVITTGARQAGIIACSAGNHAQALAYHGGRLGIPVTIVMPEGTPFVKADGTLNNEITIEDFSVAMEEGTLFRDEWIQTGQRDEKGCCSRIFRFGDEGMTTFKNLTVRIRPFEEWAGDNRLYIASIDKNGKVSSLGGKLKNGAVETKTHTMGEYALKIDSIAPIVKVSNFKDGQNVSALKSLRFKISDDMTGIETYDVYLDDVWVLGQYDAKNALLYYEFDEKIKKGTNNVKVVVTDGVGNKKTFRAKVVY